MSTRVLSFHLGMVIMYLCKINVQGFQINGIEGVIVEVKDHDQYVEKIAGTVRLTLRNRRFLRYYNPHFQQQHWGFDRTLKEKNCTDKLRYPIDETSTTQKQTDTTSDVGSRMDIEVPGTIDNKHSYVGTHVTTFMPPSSDTIVDQ